MEHKKYRGMGSIQEVTENNGELDRTSRRRWHRKRKGELIINSRQDPKGIHREN